MRMNMADQIQPYSIAVLDSALDSLKSKLDAATFPNEQAFTDNWEYGSPLTDVKRLARYWRDGFDWRAQEAKLNETPQFTTSVKVDGFDELKIHFLHQRSKRQKSVPLLFCHGCTFAVSRMRVGAPLSLLSMDVSDAPMKTMADI